MRHSVSIANQNRESNYLSLLYWCSEMKIVPFTAVVGQDEDGLLL